MSDLPSRVAAGVAALQQGRPADAVAALGPVVDDAGLAAAPDLQDVRARVCSLYAQALLEAYRPADAEAPCREALRLLRRLGDRQGLAEVRALQDRIVRALAEAREQEVRLAEQRRIAATPLDALLRGVDDPAERAEVLVKKAHALADTGQGSSAAPVARDALALATTLDDVRLEVLARLALGRAEPERATAELTAAYRRAERADEFNLVAMVARAAAVAGVTLPVEHGPHTPPGAR